MKEHWCHFFRLRLAILLLSSPVSSFAQVQFWVPVRSPDGGSVIALLKDPTGLLFTGTDKGIFRSINGGVAWTLSGSTVTHKEGLVADSSGGILAGGDGLWRSTDAGSTWHPIGFTGQNVKALVVTPGNTIFVAVGSLPGTHGVFRSTDGGLEWIPCTPSDLNLSSFLCSARYGLLATGGWNSVYRWAGYDSNWIEISATLDQAHSFAEDSWGNLYAGKELAGVARSTDGGLSWDATGLASPYTVDALATVETGQLYAGVLPLDESIDGGVYASADQGLTWRSLGLKDWPVYSILAQDSSHILIGSGRGVLKTNNGGTDWEVSSEGITACDIRALLCLDSTTLFAGTGSGLFRSVDNGQTWSDWGLISRSGITSLVLDHSKNFFAATRVSTAGGGIFRSTDEGRTWRCTTQDYIQGNYVAITAFDVTSANTLVASVTNPSLPRPEIFRSSDHGETWMLVTGEPTTKPIQQFSLDSVGTIYGGSWGAGVIRSTDDGLTWTPTNQGLHTRDIYCLATRRTGDVFAGGIGGVSRSTDRGDSWSLITGNLGTIVVRALGIDAAGDIVLSTASGKVYRSSDTGETWNSDTWNDPVTTIMGFAENGGPMFAIDSLGAVYRYANSTTPARVQLLFPLNMAALSTDTVRLRWRAGGPSATKYWLEYATDSSFNHRSVDSSLVDTEYVVTALDSGSTYWWKVKAWNASGWGTFSDVRSFTFAGKSISHDMVLFDGGAFSMGSSAGDPDEAPAHTVTVSSFYLDTKEVTVAEYRAFSTATAHTMPPPPSWGWIDVHPVVNVSWDDATAYAQWKGKRLPTEAEWEYAARGGKLSHGYLYAGSTNASDVAWIAANSDSMTHPVGLKAPNELGLYDMSGNASEWCSDWYEETYYSTSPTTNPKGPATGTLRAKHGGSWLWGAFACRVSDRSGYFPMHGLEDVGFRCALDAPLTSMKDRPVAVPGSFVLEQNYPNPFNPSTVVSSQLAVASDVRMVIYDVLGREVTVLVNERRAAGKYQDTFDGTNLSSGIYICRMTAGAFVHSRKMLLIK
jgi:formylglycine-generating enzyme